MRWPGARGAPASGWRDDDARARHRPADRSRGRVVPRARAGRFSTDISLTLGAGASDNPHRTERRRENHAAPARDGPDPADLGPVTWGGRENAPPVRRAIVFQRPVDAAAQRRRQHPLCAGERGRAARASTRRAPTSCWRWSGSPASRTVRRENSPAASSSGSRWRARSRATRKSCSSTSRPRASIRPRPRPSRTSSARWPRAASRW